MVRTRRSPAACFPGSRNSRRLAMARAVRMTRCDAWRSWQGSRVVHSAAWTGCGPACRTGITDTAATQRGTAVSGSGIHGTQCNGVQVRGCASKAGRGAVVRLLAAPSLNMAARASGQPHSPACAQACRQLWQPGPRPTPLSHRYRTCSAAHVVVAARWTHRGRRQSAVRDRLEVIFDQRVRDLVRVVVREVLVPRLVRVGDAVPRTLLLFV